MAEKERKITQLPHKKYEKRKYFRGRKHKMLVTRSYQLVAKHQ